MSRYIDADALKEHIEVITYEGMWHTSETDEFVSVENIENAPTIDAVSVVRCSECRWSRPRTLKGETGYRCVFYRTYKAETGYCDIGEREGE